MIDKVKHKTKILMKGGVKTGIERNSNRWVPFSIDAKGGEKRSLMKGGE